MKKIFPIIIVMALAAGGWFWWQHRGAAESGDLTLYGNVDIRQVALAFDGNGRITEMAVEEGDLVKAGDVIGRLDTHSLELQAKAQEAVVEAQRQTLLELKAGSRREEIAQAQARVASARASAELADLQRDRAMRLVSSPDRAPSRLPPPRRSCAPPKRNWSSCGTRLRWANCGRRRMQSSVRACVNPVTWQRRSRRPMRWP